MEQELKDKNVEYEELLIEHRTFQKRLNEESSTLKLELRFKADEVTRMTSLYEEHLQKYKESQIELQTLHDKQDVIKSEYYKLESNSKQGQSDIKAENAMLKERLKNYEQIEKELDQAIMQASTGEGGSELSQALAATITQAPTTAKRRIHQSLMLSNKLLTKQKELDETNKGLKECKEKVEQQEEEIKMYKRISEKTNQPYSYLASGIEKAEKELYLADKENKNKEQVILNLKKEIEVLRKVRKLHVNIYRVKNNSRLI